MITETNPKGAGRKQKGYYKQGLNAPLLRKSFPYDGNFIIYGLASSATPNTIEYVGFTARALNSRYNDHIATAKFDGTKKEQWVKQLQYEGHNLVLVVLKEGIETLEEACYWEKYYIRILSSSFPLKNITKGGIGTLGMIHKPETKAKQSIARKYRLMKNG